MAVSMPTQAEIAQQIATLHQLQQLITRITDPEVLALARRLVNMEPGQAAPAPKFQAPHRPRGALLQLAQQAVYSIEGTFTARDVVERMKAAGYDFFGNDMVSIQPVLQKLVEEKLLKIIRRGAGRRPTTYRRYPAPEAQKGEETEP